MGALPLLTSGHLTDGRKPLIVFDRLARATLAMHESVLLEETRVTIPHNYLDALKQLCQENDVVACICDGVYSMGARLQLIHCSRFRRATDCSCTSMTLLESGSFWQKGEVYARSQLSGALGDRTIIAASLAKGFGASGGMLMLGTPRQEATFPRLCNSACFFSVAQSDRCWGRFSFCPAAPDRRNTAIVSASCGTTAFFLLIPAHRAEKRNPADPRRRDRRRAAGYFRRTRSSRSRPYVSVIFFPTVGEERQACASV